MVLLVGLTPTRFHGEQHILLFYCKCAMPDRSNVVVVVAAAAAVVVVVNDDDSGTTFRSFLGISSRGKGT